MSYTDLLTIAIPCYERKEFFLEALESALTQTVKCEIIVVDNCSSHDYFKKVCKEKGVRYYRNELNIGLYPNMNRCFKLAETEYVKLLDDDDKLSPVYVESFLKAQNLHPDIDIFFSDYVRFTSKGSSKHKYTLPFGYLGLGYKIIEYGITYNLGFPYMSSTIRRTKVHKDLDLEGVIGGFDWEWIYSTADTLSFYGDPEKLYQHRIHDKQISRKKDLVAHTITVPYIYDVIIPQKITDPLLLKKASKAATHRLIDLKSFGNRKELQNLIQAENRYGKYLRKKLDENLFLRLVYLLPSGSVRIVLHFTKSIHRWRGQRDII